MGKGSRCYNPEGQRARGPEGQRARGPEGQAGGVMSWVLSLAWSGGTAGSHGGHETRRHRVRGPFPMGACLLLAGTLALAGCGSSSSSTVAINPQETPPEPEIEPQTGDGDGGQTVTQQQQQQPQPEPEPEPEPEPQTGGGSGEGEGDGGQGAGGGTPPTDTATTEDGDGNTGSGDTTTTGGGGTGGGGTGGGGGGTGGGGNPPPNNNPPVSRSVNLPNNPPVVSSLSRSSGIPEPKEQDTYAVSRLRNGSIAGVSYSLKNAFNSDSLFNFKGKNRNVKASIIKQGTTSVDNAFNPSHAGYNFAYRNIDRHKQIEVTYTKEDGFVGASTYKGGSNDIEADVTLKATFNNPSIKALLIEGYIGDSGGIVMNGTNFGKIIFSATKADNGQFLDKQVRFSDPVIRAEIGFGEVRGSFKSYDSNDPDFPTQVVGELEMKRFFDTSPKNAYEYNDNLFKRGDNALAGVFVADKTDYEQVKYFVPLEKHLEGNLGMFSYGVWASQNFTDNRIVFLEQTTKFNPERTTSDFTSHTYHETSSGNVQFKYKREDGFKGAYIYEGETGTLTGDVDLYIGFNGFGATAATGSILTDLEIGGYDLKGIAMLNARIDTRGIDNNDGVGGIDIGADDVDDISSGSAKLSFGDFLADLNAIDKPTVSHHGLARKLTLVLSPDGIQAQGSTPETYPSQIAGEVEINQFKIKNSDGDNNTILGVFVADKQE